MRVNQLGRQLIVNLACMLAIGTLVALVATPAAAHRACTLTVCAEGFVVVGAEHCQNPGGLGQVCPIFGEGSHGWGLQAQQDPGYPIAVGNGELWFGALLRDTCQFLPGGEELGSCGTSKLMWALEDPNGCWQVTAKTSGLGATEAHHRGPGDDCE